MYGVDSGDLFRGLAERGELRALQPLTEDPALAPALGQWLMKKIPDAAPRMMWIVPGPGQDAAVMGEQLRALRAAGCEVQGFVDRAAVLAGWLQQRGHHIVVEPARQRTLISVAFHDGSAVELQRTVQLPGGLARLHDAWLQLAAQTLVQQTRFDPLHSQQHERALRAALPELAARAAREGQIEHRIEAGDRSLPLLLTRDQLAQASAPLFRPLANALQALVAGMPDASLLVDESLAGAPGAEQLLDAVPGSRAQLLPAGIAACAASLLEPAVALSSGAVQYLTRVPLPDRSVQPPALQPVQGHGAAPALMATHVVYRGRAIPILPQGLVIGREPEDAQQLRLPEGIAGLSRRHCTLRREAGRTLIVDHSQFGSYVDGARVRGRAFLAAGSVLRLGTPGIELQLVCLE